MDGSTTAYKHITVSPIAGSMGAEIQGVDLTALEDEVFDELYDAWLRHHVVVLRDQEITPDQQLAFALRFGEIHYHPYMKGMDDHPEILEIIKEPGDQYTFGSSWHTDQMFNPQPAKATMLYAKETPSCGGDGNVGVDGDNNLLTNATITAASGGNIHIHHHHGGGGGTGTGLALRASALPHHGCRLQGRGGGAGAGCCGGSRAGAPAGGFGGRPGCGRHRCQAG